MNTSNSFVFQKVINNRCKRQELCLPGYTYYLILNRFCHFSGILLSSTKVKPGGVREAYDQKTEKVWPFVKQWE